MHASLVIPAHNEAGVLPATLQRLADDRLARTLEVVVVANRCDDDTADVARTFKDALPGLVVIETDIPGKTNALNLGDGAATAFPRIYLDADIVLGPDALQGLVDGLTVDAPIAGSPEIRFDLDGADALVRAYYRVFTLLPYVREGLLGLGVYGVSESGRARFDTFPDVLADDLYLQRLFEPGERVRTRGSFSVRTPRRWRQLLKVRTRVDRGNAQLASTPAPGDGPGFERTSGSSIRVLGRLVASTPGLLPSAVVYVATTVVAKVGAYFSDNQTWGRDESSRQLPDAGQSQHLSDGVTEVSRG